MFDIYLLYVITSSSYPKKADNAEAPIRSVDMNIDLFYKLFLRHNTRSCFKIVNQVQDQGGIHCSTAGI